MCMPDTGTGIYIFIHDGWLEISKNDIDGQTLMFAFLIRPLYIQRYKMLGPKDKEHYSKGICNYSFWVGIGPECRYKGL